MKKNEIKWLEAHGLSEPPVCMNCGGPVAWRGPKYGYSMFCSRECLSKSSYRKEKIKATLQKRYGISNLMQSDVFRKKKEATNLKKYGVSNPMQSDAVRKKLEATNLKKYGVKNPFADKDIIKRIKKTQILKYGGMGNGSKQTSKKIEATNIQRHGWNGYNNREAYKATLKERYGNENYVNTEAQLKTVQAKEIARKEYLVGYTSDGNWICKCPHPDCNKCSGKQFITDGGVYRTRTHHNVETCTILNPINQQESWCENELRDFIRELGFEPEKNRTVLDGLELDIYIPQKKIAIEFNGVYWHSSKFKSPKYHFSKFKQCLDAGIQLITIWEDQWQNKKDICKEIIRSKLGIYDQRIYARKCKVVSVDSKQTTKFMDRYHIQGKAQGSIRLGLEYNGEIVCLMTFGKKRSSMMGTREKTEGEYELVRFCGKPGVQVVGGASRLFKHFLDITPDVKIVKSYSSNDISMGKLYQALGFERISLQYGNYWYIEKNTNKRFHRYNFCKAKLRDMGFDTEHLTESQIMDTLPYYKIVDTGMMTWVFQL